MVTWLVDVSKMTTFPIHHARWHFASGEDHTVKSHCFEIVDFPCIFRCGCTTKEVRLLGLGLRLQDETAELNQRIQRVAWPKEEPWRAMTKFDQMVGTHWFSMIFHCHLTRGGIVSVNLWEAQIGTEICWTHGSESKMICYRMPCLWILKDVWFSGALEHHHLPPRNLGSDSLSPWSCQAAALNLQVTSESQMNKDSQSGDLETCKMSSMLVSWGNDLGPTPKELRNRF